jgi:2-polyprenyl-3-methyl-5-hydroxy-6-metoxy-1,4-benzoquinol methylase
LEVSGNLRRDLQWKSYARLTYPDFDLCAPNREVGQFDVVICEQVLEHVPDPLAAARTLYDLARPGGYLLVSTPFLMKIHASPDDYWRFAPRTLVCILQEAGFAVDDVRQWGNRTAAATALIGWVRDFRWLPKRNHPEFPVVIWTFAQRPG